MTKSKAVTKKNGITDVSTDVIDMSQDAGRGSEGVDKNSLALPFIAVLQALSPAVENQEPEGAKAGLFMDPITQELMSEMKIIPCGFQRRYIRWAPRHTGGGFLGMYDPIEIDAGKFETYRDDKGKLRIGMEDTATKNDDFITDTRIHYMMYQTKSGSWKPGILSLASTQIKKSRRFMSLIQGREKIDLNGKVYAPPSYGNSYLVTTVKEQNDSGTWHSIHIVVDEEVTNPELYAKCKYFNEEILTGSVKAKLKTNDEKENDGKF